MSLRAAVQESGALLWLGTQMTPQITVKAQNRPCKLCIAVPSIGNQQLFAEQEEGSQRLWQERRQQVSHCQSEKTEFWNVESHGH